MEIIYNKEYYGKYINDWSPDLKNKYVITGVQAGGNGLITKIGRVAQVRLEAGDYGSDCVLLRHANDVLTPHENQSFWLIPDKFNSYFDEIFKDAYLDDSDKFEYSIRGNEKEKGFIINSKIKENESTPMRDIKGKINDLLK